MAHTGYGHYYKADGYFQKTTYQIFPFVDFFDIGTFNFLDNDRNTIWVFLANFV